jgi:hypothetical protein
VTRRRADQRDPAEFDRVSGDPVALEREAALVARRPKQLILRVD